MEALDIIYTDDIQVVNGDLKIEYSDQQHINHIIEAEPGKFYQYPDIGYGANKLINSAINVQYEKKAIKKALELDNYIVNEIAIGKNEFNEIIFEIDAIRTQ